MAASSHRNKSYCSSFDTGTYLTMNLIEEMSNPELVTTVENETKTNRQLFLENDIFERYLNRAEPVLLHNVDQMMQQAAHADAHHQRLTEMSSRMSSRTASFSQFNYSSMSLYSAVKKSTNVQESVRPSISFAGTPKDIKNLLSISPSPTRTAHSAKEGPSINVSHKMDMCTREMEELKTSFEHLKNVYAKRKAHFTAEIEEISTMLEEIKQTSAKLVEKVVINGVDPLTKKVPAQVFIRFMQEWFRKADLLSGQLRLRTDSFRELCKKLSQQLEEKIELGETLHSVDFEFQEIQIMEVTKQLTAKNRDLQLLKKDTSSTHREFVAFKDRLAEQLATLAKLKTKTSDKERCIAVMQSERDFVEKDVAAAESELANIKRLRKKYTVPDVLEYAKLKHQCHCLKREAKIWERRFGLQHKALGLVMEKIHSIKRASK